MIHSAMDGLTVTTNDMAIMSANALINAFHQHTISIDQQKYVAQRIIDQ
jgi:hypothetical protein